MFNLRSLWDGAHLEYSRCCRLNGGSSIAQPHAHRSVDVTLNGIAGIILYEVFLQSSCGHLTVGTNLEVGITIEGEHITGGIAFLRGRGSIDATYLHHLIGHRVEVDDTDSGYAAVTERHCCGLGHTWNGHPVLVVVCTSSKSGYKCQSEKYFLHHNRFLF